jgi:hypothetical protein
MFNESCLLINGKLSGDLRARVEVG